MTISMPLRRGLVALGVVGALAGGVATVRAAAEWTAQSAPLAVAPESAADLTTRLEAESARSAALEAELETLRARSADLADALDAATAQIGTDTATAQELRDRLAAAKRRLAALERLIARTRATATTTHRSQATAPPSSGEHEDHEEDDGD